MTCLACGALYDTKVMVSPLATGKNTNINLIIYPQSATQLKSSWPKWHISQLLVLVCLAVDAISFVTVVVVELSNRTVAIAGQKGQPRTFSLVYGKPAENSEFSGNMG
jgi:hypothetical protein